MIVGRNAEVPAAQAFEHMQMKEAIAIEGNVGTACKVFHQRRLHQLTFVSPRSDGQVSQDSGFPPFARKMRQRLCEPAGDDTQA